MVTYLGIIGMLSVFIILLGYLVAPKTYNDTEKLSPYECGFSVYNSAKAAMNIRYYIICLLYLLFDLELSFLLPLIFADLEFVDITKLSIFILILLLGLILEFNTDIVKSCSSSTFTSTSSSKYSY